MRHHRIITAVAVLAASVLLAACSGGSGSSAGPETSAAAEASPSPEAATTIVTGTISCGEDPADTDSEDAVVLALCEWTMSDPRLNGTQHVVVLGPDEQLQELHVAWAQEAPLTTADGEWTCKQFTLGAYDVGTGLFEEVCRGSGPSAGLVAYLHGVSDDALGTIGITGWIDEGR